MASTRSTPVTDDSGVMSEQYSAQQEMAGNSPTSINEASGVSESYLDEQSKMLTETVMDATEEQEAESAKNKYGVQVITKYMCRYCARQFDSPSEMQAHIATHARGKSNTQCHSCYVCGKTYATPSKLQRHVRVHSGERPYACNICGRRFTRSDHVKQHLKVHMPQKQRNTCRVCGMKFLRRQTLHSHLQQNHGVSQVYTCHRCGEAFDRVEKLHQHKHSHLNADAQNTLPLVIDGVVVKREQVNTNDDDSSNYVVGLAKFSLGPQPQVPEDAAGQQGQVVTENVAGETLLGEERLNIMVDYQGDSNSMDASHNQSVGNSECSMEISSCYSLAENTKMENYDGGDASTVTDGEQMYILSPDELDIDKIKHEKPDDEEYGNQTKDDMSEIRGITQSGKTNGVGDVIKREAQSDQCEQANFDSDDGSLKEPAKTITDKPKMNIMGPASYKAAKMVTERPKMNTMGPASYKAAVRNKIQMNFPGPRNHPLKVQDTSLLGYTNLNKVGTQNSSVNSYMTSSFTQKTVPYGKKLSRCEHCCIWFEDYTMCLLHNSLHSADDSDPFTCRKCLKKLGNRIEFTAHLVWHLEPNMDG